LASIRSHRAIGNHKEAVMTARRRISTAILVSLGFAASAGPALALPTDINANGTEVPAGSLSDRTQAIAPPTSPTIVRVSPRSGAFDWGDAGIGAGGGFALSMIVVGGALVAFQRRDRRTHGSAALTR
jgi:hypothetical protein